MQMKELTRMTGVLNNVQVAQLKMWPKIILAADNAEVEFDPEAYSVTVEVSDLDYRSIGEGASEDLVVVYKRRMERFNQAVKFLLGDDYAVLVKMRGKVLASFPPISPPLAAHQPLLEKKK